MPSADVFIFPLRYNSQCIALPEWVSIWTIALAPLIAHIIAGAPLVTLLTRNRPKWHDSLCHYNPTSIIWRYAAITDRRLRAARWSRSDVAASNAIFWTAKGWNGSEDMVREAAPYCVRYPELTHARIVSVSALKTIITAMQGVSALYMFIGLLAGDESLALTGVMGVDTVFFPLAVLGLLRLCAAPWLIEDFEYAPQIEGKDQVFRQDAARLDHNNYEIQSLGTSDTLDPFLLAPFQPAAQFTSPRSSWQSLVFRLLYLVFVGGIWALTLVSFVPGVSSFPSRFTTTSFIVGLFYFFILSISLVLYTFYFIRSQTTTTLLPCISATWYKIYTVVVMGFMFVVFVVASIETNRLPNGNYSSLPILERLECRYRMRWTALNLGFFDSPDFFGIASKLSQITTVLGETIMGVPVMAVSSNISSSNDTVWLYNVTGYIVGQTSEVAR